MRAQAREVTSAARTIWAKIAQRKRRPGRPRIDSEIQRVIGLMAQDGWGAPRIQGELLDHVIVFDRRHLIRLMGAYLAYYREDRCHFALAKDAPSGRNLASRPSGTAKVVALPRVGGLHHRYAWREAA